MTYENILLEKHGKVTLIRLNRPKALNALSPDLTRELAQALDIVEADDDIAVVVTNPGTVVVHHCFIVVQ